MKHCRQAQVSKRSERHGRTVLEFSVRFMHRAVMGQCAEGQEGLAQGRRGEAVRAGDVGEDMNDLPG